ncbi:hypothetical protein LOC54_01965 [Acetobacter sp. AN02]|uniref:phage fiber-tail adaptor protein n=1 Tax=Acetobacter sp. AN02 TaxID=2894186 RepID=UPI002434585F|nr:hypothetical protein [Acetobacter sp. AN02]MDG6093887.1 hypothetical protein [Acetobacter sp. AN02]
MNRSTLPDDLVPVAARTVRLRNSHSVSVPLFPPCLHPKASADILDYSVDWSLRFRGTGDRITTVTAKVPSATGTSTDLTVMWSGVYCDLTSVFMLASGPPLTAQNVLVEIATEQGRKDSVLLSIRVTDATPGTPPPSGTVTLPSDTTSNGGVAMTAMDTLTAPLSSNGGVIMTSDDLALPSGTVSNGGVVMETAAS